jgi:hypothetical protein
MAKLFDTIQCSLNSLPYKRQMLFRTHKLNYKNIGNFLDIIIACEEENDQLHIK